MVVLDDQVLEVKTPTLAAALEAGRAAAESRGRVIVEATLDGLPLTDEQLDNRALAIGPGSSVRLVTADPQELVRTSLLDAAPALEQAAADQRAVAELIHTGSMEEAMDRLQGVLGAWELVQQTVSQGLALRGDGGGREDALVADSTRSLKASLAEVFRSLRAQDWSGLADAVEFDLSGQAERWGRMLRELAAAGAGKEGGKA